MTYLAAQLPLDNREITEKPGKIYMLPFIMLFMSSMVVYKIGTTSRSATALAYEQEHGKRKGAIAALESALEHQGGES